MQRIIQLKPGQPPNLVVRRIQQEAVGLSLQARYSATVNNHLSTREYINLCNDVNSVWPIEPRISVLVDGAIEGRDIELEWVGVPHVPGRALRMGSAGANVDVEVELAPGGAVGGDVEEDFGVRLVEC
jgi:hypothetical protein